MTDQSSCVGTCMSGTASQVEWAQRIRCVGEVQSLHLEMRTLHKTIAGTSVQ